MVSSLNSMMYQLDQLGEINSKVTYGLSTGDALEFGSDDASTYDMVLSFQKEIRTYESIQSQIEDASVLNTFSDSALAEVKTHIETIQANLLESLNDTVNSDDKVIISNEINDIKASLLSLANTTADGKYIFAGTSYDTAPFVEDEVTGEVTYIGNNEDLNVNVDKGKYVTQGASGIEAFYYTTATAATGDTVEFEANDVIIDSDGNEWKFIDSDNDGNIDTDKIYLNGDVTATSINVTDLGTTPATYSFTNTETTELEVKHSLFDDLNEIITTLGDTSLTDDEQDAILSVALENIESAFDNVNIAHSIVGSSTSLIENYGDVIQTKITNYTIFEEEYAAADLTELAMQSQALENTYTALYSTINRVNNLSLVNYLS